MPRLVHAQNTVHALHRTAGTHGASQYRRHFSVPPSPVGIQLLAYLLLDQMCHMSGPAGLRSSACSNFFGVLLAPLVEVRVGLEVDENIAEVREPVQQLILDQMTDAVALIDGLFGADLDVNIDEVLETRFADPELVDALDAWNIGGRLADLIDKGAGGLGVHQLLALDHNSRAPEVTITATTKRAAI